MGKKFIKNKHGEHFRVALAITFLSIAVFAVAFMSEDRKMTGFATSTYPSNAIEPSLREFRNVDSLSSLSTGNYYIDSDGIVYWIDDKSKPVVGKVKSVDEIEKNRHIYVDANGNLGYVIK